MTVSYVPLLDWHDRSVEELRAVGNRDRDVLYAARSPAYMRGRTAETFRKLCDEMIPSMPVLEEQ